MKLTLEAIEAIDAIERCGTYAAAAEELNKVPSALTYIVQKLESDLGVTVFDRTGHRAKLTDTGKLLLQRGRELLRDVRDLECRARRINEGWESELRIAVDTIVPFAAMVPYISAFYGETNTTRLRFYHEVLGGTWDALHTRRADLVIGAMGDAPCAGIEVRPIGTLDMVFCVAPGHPLAQAAEPLKPREVARFRAIAIGDTSRQLSPRSLGLFEAQETLTVSSHEAKMALQLAGLGVGYLPACVAQPYLDRGELVAKQLATPTTPRTFYLGWHADHQGEAMSWWIKNLSSTNTLAEMWLRQGR
jgi:DNA-binding transcriptional LysR family regulator